MQFMITDEDSHKAKHPHEIFLINLITNHILMFVGLLGMAKSYPLLMLFTPGISLIVLTYLLWRANKSLRHDAWFVSCHWQLCARRSKFFIGMMLFLGLIIVGLIMLVGGDPAKLRPGHYALGGIAFLPTLISVLALIVMESDAMHKAKTGVVPDWLVKKFPNPETVPASA